VFAIEHRPNRIVLSLLAAPLVDPIVSGLELFFHDFLPRLDLF
jgi:hypothetical protein